MILHSPDDSLLLLIVLLAMLVLQAPNLTNRFVYSTALGERHLRQHLSEQHLRGSVDTFAPFEEGGFCSGLGKHLFTFFAEVGL